jgi:osmoprotectant transport system permease protein
MKLPGKAVLPWAPTALAGLAFLAWVLRFDLFEALLSPIVTRKAIFTERESLAVLAGQHLLLVAATSIPAFIAAFLSAMAMSRIATASTRSFFLHVSSLGETVPTVALMALLVPTLGYGFAPVASALFLYGLLPVFRNTLTGVDATPCGIVEAAEGCGMTEAQILWRIRLPWALPLVIQGVRISLVINIAAATVGAVAGAGGLGSVILSGLRSFDSLMILKGSVPVALLALCADSALRVVERDMDKSRRGL